MPLTAVASWVLFPALFVAAALGTGLLIGRALRMSVPLALLAPLGLCLQMSATYALYQAGAGAVVVVPAMLVLAVAGWVVGWRELRRLARASIDLLPLAVAGAATFLLYLGPVLASGQPTFTGYNFVNDTAVQLMLADRLADTGADSVPGGPVGDSTRRNTLYNYLTTAYPLGTHSVLASWRFLPGSDLHHLYQPLLALLVALAALSMFQLVRGSGVGRWIAAAAVPVILGSNLAYVYALQGNIKEIGALFGVVTTVALARELLAGQQRVRHAALVGLAAAAAVLSWNLAAAPFLLPVAVLLGVLLLTTRRSRRDLPRVALAGSASFVLFGLPVLISSRRFAEAQTGAAAASPNEMGHLLGPLKVAQTAGIWLTGDYRLPPQNPTLLLATKVLVVLVVVLVIIGAGWLLLRDRRGGWRSARAWGPFLLGASALGGWLIASPSATPYSDGKLLAVGSPAVLLLALFGVVALAAWRRPLVAATVAAAVAAGVVLSDALAYHDVRLAPIERLEALKDVDRQLAGVRGQVLLNENEEYSKYLTPRLKVNAAYEAPSPAWAEVRNGGLWQFNYWNLDALQFDYVQRFPYIVTRTSPGESRPPLNYELAYRNRYYEAWRRRSTPDIAVHLPLGGRFQREGRARCGKVRSMLGELGADEKLMASVPPATRVLELGPLGLVPHWPPDPVYPQDLVPHGPARAAFELPVQRTGRFEVWVRGTFGRPIEISVDGQPIGEANGVDTIGQYTRVGSVELAAGRHQMTLERAGGSLAPGDGYKGRVGAITISRAQEPARVVQVESSNVRQLCRRRLDWLEVVRGPVPEDRQAIARGAGRGQRTAARTGGPASTTSIQSSR